MVEHRTPNPGAGGSSPSWPATFHTRRSWRSGRRTRKRPRRPNRSQAKTKGKGGDSASLGEKVGQLKEFFEESKVEIKKVTWPSRKETITTCVAVLILTVVMAAYLGVVDVILSKIIEAILSR